VIHRSSERDGDEEVLDVGRFAGHRGATTMGDTEVRAHQELRTGVLRMVMTRLIILVLAAGLLGCSKTSSSPVKPTALVIPADEALVRFRSDLIAALGNLAPDSKDETVAEQNLHVELSRLIEQYSPSLRPKSGWKKYVSSDNSLVLVIAANGPDGDSGENASASDGQARLVVAVGGDGGAGRRGKTAGAGGSGNAEAPNGIAVALGGHGGNGGEGSGGGDAGGGSNGGDGPGGGGGGGAGDAAGSVGSIGLGGQGGKGHGRGGDGGTGSGNGITNPKAIIELVNVLKKKQGG